MDFIKDKKHTAFNCENETEWKGPFYFIQGADTQFGMIDSFIEKKTSPGWEKEKELAKICVDKINSLRPKPKFFVICGDLCDAWPYGDTEPIRKQQEQDFIDIFSKVDREIPLVCVCGNHDVGNQPTVQTVDRYRSVFGQDYFSFFVSGVKFIVLNSQYYFDGSMIPDLVNDQEAWLKKEISDPGSPPGPIIFQHIPPFVKTPDETDSGYFSLDPSKRAPFLDFLYNAGVRYIFCGHYHRNAGGFFKDLEVIVTSAVGAQLGDDQSGFRIVSIGPNKAVSHKYYSFDEVPAQVEL